METAFYIAGIALAVSAVIVSFIGLKSEKFPGKAGAVVVLAFAAGAIAASTFVVIYSQEHEEHREHELEQANETIEAEEHGEPFEEAEEENLREEDEDGSGGGSEEGGSPMGSVEQGEQVFTAVGCAGCHTFAAAGSTGATGPDLDESITADDSREAIEEMIVDPENEIAPGFSPGIMPATYGESLSEEELADLVEFIYANSAAAA